MTPSQGKPSRKIRCGSSSSSCGTIMCTANTTRHSTSFSTPECESPNSVDLPSKTSTWRTTSSPSTISFCGHPRWSTSSNQQRPMPEHGNFRLQKMWHTASGQLLRTDLYRRWRSSWTVTADFCTWTRTGCRRWICTGSTDSTMPCRGTTTSTGFRCRTSRPMCAATPIAPIWQKPE